MGCRPTDILRTTTRAAKILRRTSVNVAETTKVGVSVRWASMCPQCVGDSMHPCAGYNLKASSMCHRCATEFWITSWDLRPFCSGQSVRHDRSSSPKRSTGCILGSNHPASKFVVTIESSGQNQSDPTRSGYTFRQPYHFPYMYPRNRLVRWRNRKRTE